MDCINYIICGDCLIKMAELPDQCIDLILSDLPYGSTGCHWDQVIDLQAMWKQFERIMKPKAAIVLTASQPFTTTLIHSNLKLFKYCWVWNKKKPGNIFLAEHQPLKIHEDIVVFGIDPAYYPIKTPRLMEKKTKNYGTGESMGGNKEPEGKVYTYNDKYPFSIIEISNAKQIGKVHPTQKPVPLFEYLIKTYTRKGDLVLDCCSGSGTTALAARLTDRKFICFDISEEYCEIARERLSKTYYNEELF